MISSPGGLDNVHVVPVDVHAQDVDRGKGLIADAAVEGVEGRGGESTGVFHASLHRHLRGKRREVRRWTSLPIILILALPVPALLQLMIIHYL